MKSGDSPENLDEFVRLASRPIKGKRLAGLARSDFDALPTITAILLEDSFNLAQQHSLSNPKLSWAISYVVTLAAKRQKVEKVLEARAAWNLGWSANEWAEPRLAEQALSAAKRLFEQIGNRGWVAACDWQLNALPWTKTDFKATKQALEDALAGLHNGMEAFIPRCRQSLAFANLLLNTPETLRLAEQLIEAAEEAFNLSGDALGRARAQRQRAALLTRRSNRAEAVAILQELRKTFAELDAPIDLARVNFQLAVNYSTMGAPIDEALSLYQQALETYRTTELSLMGAECLGGLGILFTRQGAFEDAEQNLAEARKIFERYQIPGLLADNLGDSGRLAVVAGDYALALNRFQRALEINQRISSPLQAAIAKTNLGHTHAKMGHYQTALVQLEEVCRDLEDMENPGRLGDCRLYLANVWAHLGQHAEALRLLDAIQQEAPGELKALAFEARLATAYCLIGSLHYGEARNLILGELERWQNSLAKPDLPLLRRALGFLQFHERDAEAETTLQQALAEFKALGMAEEEASCLMLLAEIYAASKRSKEASSVWRKALSRVGEGSPEIHLGCFTGLASLYDEAGQNLRAFHMYQKASKAVRELAADFWQPSIFSWHIAKLSPNVEKILRFFLSHEHPEEAALLLENIKAHTFIQELLEDAGQPDINQKRIDQLRTSIEKVQEEIQSKSKVGDWLTTLAESQADYAKLIPLVDNLERQYGYVQREGGKKTKGTRANFDIRHFRAMANKRLGRNWISIDYYVTDHEIILAFLTPNQFSLRARKLSPRIKMAMASSQHSQPGYGIPRQDLVVLAEQLIPIELMGNIKERHVLILSPHKALWSIPWPGLPLGDQSANLVDKFSVATVPSLESLVMLWERSKPKRTPAQHKGGFIGLSKFKAQLNHLPFVLEEFEYLKSNTAIELKPLLNEQATHENVLQFLGEPARDGGKKLDFLHLATHIHYEERSKVLCHIQLDDRRVWSEELFPSRNLPGLVFISACNGASSFAYEGGEQIGLPLTCLSSGANSVIGSWSAISDEAALRLTKMFYQQLVRNRRPVAEALARAQQQLRDFGSSFSDWAYFSCLGMPDCIL